MKHLSIKVYTAVLNNWTIKTFKTRISAENYLWKNNGWILKVFLNKESESCWEKPLEVMRWFIWKN